MGILTIICVSNIIILIALYIYFTYAYNYWRRKGIPSLPPIFPLGTTKEMAFLKMGAGEYGKVQYDALKKLNRDFGGHYLFHVPALFVLNPEYIKYVTIKDFHHFENRGLHHDEEVDPLNCNLIILAGEKWKRTRMKVSPAFTSGKMKGMFNTILESTKGVDNVLDEPVKKGESIDIRDVVFRAIIDNIGLCVFGVECNSLRNPNAEFYKYGNLYIETTLSNGILLSIGLYLPWILKFFKIPITNKRVSKFFLETIRQTIEFRKNNNVIRNDFMDHFIKLMDDYTEGLNDGLRFTEVAAQAFAFFVAGFETSASTITYGLLEMALNHKIQNRLRDEIKRVLEKNEGEVTYDCLSEMTYMDKVVSETLRKYPPLPIMGRDCTKTYTFPGTNLTIDKGVGVWVSILGIHRDPEYYPDPDTFDPERFSEEEISKRPPGSYIPFGDGPRICIGQRFALLQIKLTLLKLLRDYVFEVDPRTVYPVEFHPLGFFLAPKHKIWLRATKV